MELLGLMEVLERLVLRVRLEHLVRWEQLVQPESVEMLVRTGIQARKDYRERLEILGRQDKRDFRDLQDPPAHLAMQDSLVRLALPEPLDLSAPLVHQVQSAR